MPQLLQSESSRRQQPGMGLHMQCEVLKEPSRIDLRKQARPRQEAEQRPGVV
jgi:hypothetical protein